MAEPRDAVAARLLRSTLTAIVGSFNAVYRRLRGPKVRHAARWLVKFNQRAFTRFEIRLYRRSNRSLGSALAGAPVLLLTTTGRRTGRLRTTPLAYMRDGTDFLVVGAYGGLPWNPNWYQNVLAHPLAIVELEELSMEVDASVVTGPERETLWPRMIDAIATLAKSETLAAPRQIPLIRLRRRP